MKTLVIVARGLRAGALGCYGNDWIRTPCLDQLACQGIVFDQYFADAASPSGARNAWRSGTYQLPSLNESAPDLVLPDLLDVFKGQGVPTTLIVDDARLPPFEFVQGWSQVVNPLPSGEDTVAEATLEAVQTSLEQITQQPHALLLVELAAALPPWDIPVDFVEGYFDEARSNAIDSEGDVKEMPEEGPGEETFPLAEPVLDPQPGLLGADADEQYLALQGSYAAAVSFLDAIVGQILEMLDDLEMTDETAVVVVSDVGQSLGEHGVVGPIRPWLHEEVVHLPLLIRLPGQAHAGRRVSALVQAVDLAPTLAGLQGVPFPACHGQDLSPLWQGKIQHLRDYACSGCRVGDGVEWSLRTSACALLVPVRETEDSHRVTQLYVKPEDRWEFNNVRHHMLDWSEALEQTLRNFVQAANSSPLPFDPPALPSLQEEPGELV